MDSRGIFFDENTEQVFDYYDLLNSSIKNLRIAKIVDIDIDTATCVIEFLDVKGVREKVPVSMPVSDYGGFFYMPVPNQTVVLGWFRPNNKFEILAYLPRDWKQFREKAFWKRLKPGEFIVKSHGGAEVVGDNKGNIILRDKSLGEIRLNAIDKEISVKSHSKIFIEGSNSRVVIGKQDIQDGEEILDQLLQLGLPVETISQILSNENIVFETEIDDCKIEIKMKADKNVLGSKSVLELSAKKGGTEKAKLEITTDGTVKILSDASVEINTSELSKKQVALKGHKCDATLEMKMWMEQVNFFLNALKVLIPGLQETVASAPQTVATIVEGSSKVIAGE